METKERREGKKIKKGGEEEYDKRKVRKNKVRK